MRPILHQVRVPGLPKQRKEWPKGATPGVLWTGAPTYSLNEGTVYSNQPVPVTAGGSIITLEWVSPGVIGDYPWITLNSGTTPTISFSGHVDADDLSNVVIRATANGVPVESDPGTVTVSAAGASDWTTRIADAGVVWYHSFDTASEVNQFRWSNGTGHDPQALAPYASNMTWVSSGGADGGAYMRLYRPTGVYNPTDDNWTTSDGTYWWRPFSPLTGASNGRGVDDPGANGALPAQTFSPTQGQTQILNWIDGARPGWYGNSDYHSGTLFDGTDFYLQVRVRVDPNRTTTGNVINGKLVNFSTTRLSYTNQELVTVSAWPTPAGVGTANVHDMYDGTYAQIQDKSTGSLKNTTSPQWSYSFGWDTLLFHVTPGHQNVNVVPPVKDTRLEVWAAHEGDSEYTKIWDVMYDAYFDTPEQFTPNMKNGWNGFIAWIYQNGTLNTPFFQEYDQIIFSKAFIACPQAATALEQLAGTMAAGDWEELGTTNSIYPTYRLPNNPSGDAGYSIFEYCDKMVRNNSEKKVYFIGCSRLNNYQGSTTTGLDAGYIYYDEATNTWGVVPPTQAVNAAAHGYNHAALNQDTGDFYWIEGGYQSNHVLWKRSGDTWTNPTYPTSTGGTQSGGLDWFPELNALVWIDGGQGFTPYVQVLPAGSSTWTKIEITGFAISDYSNFSRYSPQHQCIYFGGGSNVLAKFTAAGGGTITQCASAPAAVSFGLSGGSTQTTCAIDPLTGDLVVFSPNGNVYSFNGTSWATNGTHPLGDGTGQLIAAACSNTSAGVIMVANYRGSLSKTYLYKHG